MLPGNLLIAPGDFVRHPKHPELGLGRVQTVVQGRITVNFENAGKLIVDGEKVELEPTTPE